MTRKTWFVAPVMFIVSLAASGKEPLVTGYHLRPAAAVTMPGKAVKLRLVYCFPKDNRQPAKAAPRGKLEIKMGEPVEVTPGSQKKAPPVTLVCEGDEGYGEELAPLVVPTNVEWKVDGPGRVSGDKKGATYHAPASKPTPNKATVAASLTYNVGREKTILLSRITILDEVKTYSGSFSMHEVTVNSEYTANLTGNIRWDFTEYYDIGGWREYSGSGTATYRIDRIGCGTPAEFSGVPVEGSLKVHDDGRYEFLISLVGDKEQTRTCRRPDLDKKLKWEETYSIAGTAMNSGDPCGAKEFYPRYQDMTRLGFGRDGSCTGNIRNRYKEGWSFEAVE